MKKKVQVVVFKEVDGKSYLLLLKTNKKRGGFWQNVTGSVDRQEQFIEAAHRELAEETGIRVNKKCLHFTEVILKYNSPRSNRPIKEKIYSVVVQEEFKVKLDSREHQDFRWVQLEKVCERDFGYFSNWLGYLAGKHICFG